MGALFRFFLRLFGCFVAAKFLLQAVGWEGRQYLLGLTILLVANVYWLSYLVFRDRGAGDLRPPAVRPPERAAAPEKSPPEPSSGN